MTAPTKTWKTAEAKILRYWGARRRGAHTGSGAAGSGYPDNHDDLKGWSIEVKHAKRPTFGLMQAAVAQARQNRLQPGDIPVAVIHKEGMDYSQSLVVMSLEDFSGFFINQQEVQDE